MLWHGHVCYSTLAHKNTAELLKSNLEQNGLTPRKLGHTFTSDIIQKNGNIATSAIDHIYVSKDLELLRQAKSIGIVKKEIKKFVKNLPI